MLTLIAEIMLTVAAWRKGWRWWALLPAFMAFTLGFFAGVMVQPLGSNVFSLAPYTLLIDLIAIVALVCMAGTDRHDRGPSFAQIRALIKETDDDQATPKRALSSYGDE